MHIHARPRLLRRLGASDDASIRVLIGPAGSGKTALLRAAGGGAGAIVFRVGNERATFARFVYGFAQAIAAVAPGAQASFPRAWERALQSHRTSTVLAHWLCEHMAGIDGQIVIDDVHDAAADLDIAAFIAKIAELRPAASLTIAVRSVGALPIALWMATRRMERPIEAAELNLDRAEVSAAAEDAGVPLAAPAVDALLLATGGLASAVAYALMRRRCAPAAAAGFIPATFADIAAQIFARRSGRERAFLLTAALFPAGDDDVLARSGWDDAAALRSAMADDAPYMWEAQTAAGFRFHDRFGDYLRAEFQARDCDFRASLARGAVGSLDAVGRHAEALEVATRERLIDAMGELINAHGFEILESGEIDVISEALTAFPDSNGRLGAKALGLRGYLEARSGRLDTAEAWFRLALEKAGDEASRVTIAMYYARELAQRRREDAYEVLEPFAGSTTLPRSLLVDVRSSYAQALAAAGRCDEACARTDDALALLAADSPPALRARVYARAAYVALESGLAGAARERALIAAPLAVEQTLYDVAASTYSVLYNIAYEVDDDAAASLSHLRRMRDLGVKSGTLRLDVYVMLCTYELLAEAGDGAALAELDRDLAAVDTHDATAQMMETLLPAKALQAAWIGNFEDAERLVRRTAEHQATAVRRALCWARIALFCAAAGADDRAQEAASTAEIALQQSDDRTTPFGLTLLTLALAALVRGDIACVRERLARADEAVLGPAPRLRALRAVIVAMSAGFTDPVRFAQGVPGTLRALDAVGYGGIARLIEALPYPFAHGHATHTVGTALATSELSARFAAAIEREDPAALLDWLDTQRSGAFGSVAVTARFEQWAADSGEPDARARAAVGQLRERLAGYRRPAPVVMRHVDDIDAAIDELFVNLDIAAPLMAEHSRAVSAWCSRLARSLGLAEREIEFITRCGLIHDIGKMRTPSEILHAPRGLTPQEWAIMRDHAAEGGRIIAALPLLRQFVPIVRGHHERLDGQGYPDGLKAGAIPLAARIVSVADCFNAMIGRRPYRLPMAPNDALDELERHRGTQFDPEVVAAMVRIVLGRLHELPQRPSDGQFPAYTYFTNPAADTHKVSS